MSQYKIDKIIQQMASLHIMFCMPKIVINKATGEVITFEHHWINDEAKETYGKLAEVLLYEQQTFQQSMHPTSGILRDLQASSDLECFINLKILPTPPTRG